MNLPLPIQWRSTRPPTFSKPAYKHFEKEKKNLSPFNHHWATKVIPGGPSVSTMKCSFPLTYTLIIRML